MALRVNVEAAVGSEILADRGPVGTRVKFSGLWLERQSPKSAQILTPRRGTVVGYSANYPETGVRIHWDGLKGISGFHEDFLARVDPEAR